MPSHNPPKGMTKITFNLTEDERSHLASYCEEQGRTMTEILRELIRNLKVKPKSDRT